MPCLFCWRVLERFWLIFRSLSILLKRQTKMSSSVEHPFLCKLSVFFNYGVSFIRIVKFVCFQFILVHSCWWFVVWTRHMGWEGRYFHQPIFIEHSYTANSPFTPFFFPFYLLCRCSGRLLEKSVRRAGSWANSQGQSCKFVLYWINFIIIGTSWFNKGDNVSEGVGWQSLSWWSVVLVS